MTAGNGRPPPQAQALPVTSGAIREGRRIGQPFPWAPWNKPNWVYMTLYTVHCISMHSISIRVLKQNLI